MQLHIRDELRASVDLINFQRDYSEETEMILREQYAIPLSDLSMLNHKLLDRVASSLSNATGNATVRILNMFHRFAAEETSKLQLQMSKNFGLTEMGFVEMRNALRQGNEELFEKVFLAHFESCIQYLMSNYTLTRENAYDASMDALIEFRRKLIADKIGYGNMRFLFTRMASQIYLKSKSKNMRVEGLTYDDESTVDQDDMIALDKAISQLGPECQELLRLNFYEKMKISEIAVLKDKSAASLRKAKQRCIEQLRIFFTNNIQS